MKIAEKSAGCFKAETTCPTVLFEVLQTKMAVAAYKEGFFPRPSKSG